MDKHSTYVLKMLNLDEGELDIDIVYVDEIPLEKSGKIRAVISELS